MGRYCFDAVDAQGRRYRDCQEAPDKDTLLAALESRGIHVVRWVDEPATGFMAWWRRKDRLSSAQRVAFISQMAQLVRSGVSVDQALRIVADAASAEPVRQLALRVRDGVRRGRSFSESMADHGPEFGDLTCSMIRVGEVGGVLDTVLERLAEYLSRREEIKNFIVSSSIYPLVLLLVGIGSLAAILGFVIPRFAVILSDLGASVPWATQVLIVASRLFCKAWWVPPALCVPVAMAAVRYRRRPAVRRRLFRTLLSVPVLGSLFVLVDVSRFCRTLGTLLLSGVPLLKSLAIARTVVQNDLIRDAAVVLYQQVQQGQSLSGLLRQFDFFPPVLIHMAAIGEQTGRLGEMLITVAENLEADLQSRTKAYLSLLEPAVIVTMGILIGGMVVSMLLAIFGIQDIGF